MAHNHGSEYQVKVIHEDGTEALSEWREFLCDVQFVSP